MSTVLLATFYWCLKILAAAIGVVVAFIVGAFKLRQVDKKRQAKRPSSPPIIHASGADGGEKSYGTRDAPVLSSENKEEVAHLGDVIHDINTGDSGDFSGRKPHSYVNRIATWSRMSHSTMYYRDKAGLIGARGKVYVAQVVERFKFRRRGWWFTVDKGGFEFVPVEEYVAKFPGQLYWSKVAKEYDKPHLFDRTKAASAIEASRGWSYGWAGIFFQMRCKLPFIRVITYLSHWKEIDKAWDKGSPPFCSWAVSVWATIAGQDPTPCLAPQLTTPAEIERSKLWGRKVALVP